MITALASGPTFRKPRLFYYFESDDRLNMKRTNLTPGRTRRLLIQRITHIKTKTTHYPSVFEISKPETVKELYRLREEYVLLPVDKIRNNIVFVSKTRHYNYLNELFGVDFTFGNPT